MGFRLLALVAGLGVAGWYGWRALRRIEHEVRDELTAKGLAADAPGARPLPAVSGGQPLDAALLSLVREAPGILQTELYARFPAGQRRRLQETLLALARAGRLRREKAPGGSFALFPG